MLARIGQEQAEFNASGARLQAVRSVHLRHLRELLDLLATERLKTEMADLTRLLRQPGLKLGVKKPYAETFERLRASLVQAETASTEIHSMLAGVFRQLNAELGFTLHPPKPAALERFRRDLDLVERSHLQYLGVTQALRLAQPEFSERLVRALSNRLRGIFEAAQGEVELWNKSAASQLDAQLRDRRRNFTRRLEAMERIQQAAVGLDERIAELETQEAMVDVLAEKLGEFAGHLVEPSQAAGGPAPSSPSPEGGPAAALAGWLDWRIFVPATIAIATHHLLLSLLQPAGVFPNGNDVGYVPAHLADKIARVLDAERAVTAVVDQVEEFTSSGGNRLLGVVVAEGHRARPKEVEYSEMKSLQRGAAPRPVDDSPLRRALNPVARVRASKPARRSKSVSSASVRALPRPMASR